MCPLCDSQKVFDEFDRDKSGKVSLDEFSKKLKDRKAKDAPRPGEKSTLEQRKASEGLGLTDFSESAFHELDRDGSGEVEFIELLKMMFHNAES